MRGEATLPTFLVHKITLSWTKNFGYIYAKFCAVMRFKQLLNLDSDIIRFIRTIESKIHLLKSKIQDLQEFFLQYVLWLPFFFGGFSSNSTKKNPMLILPDSKWAEFYFIFVFLPTPFMKNKILLTWDLLHCLGFFNDMQKASFPLTIFLLKKKYFTRERGREFFFFLNCTPEGVVTFSSHLSRHTA